MEPLNAKLDPTRRVTDPALFRYLRGPSNQTGQMNRSFYDVAVEPGSKFLPGGALKRCVSGGCRRSESFVILGHPVSGLSRLAVQIGVHLSRAPSAAPGLWIRGICGICGPSVIGVVGAIGGPGFGSVVYLWRVHDRRHPRHRRPRLWIRGLCAICGESVIGVIRAIGGPWLWIPWHLRHLWPSEIGVIRANGGPWLWIRGICAICGRPQSRRRRHLWRIS